MLRPFRPRLLLLVLIAILVLDIGVIAGVLGKNWNAGAPAVNVPSTSKRPAAVAISGQPTQPGEQAGWQRVGPASLIHALIAGPRNSNVLYAATADGFLRSDNGGTSWKFMNMGLPTASAEIWSVLPFDHGAMLAVAADDAHVYFSSDGGIEWRPERQNLGQGSVYALTNDVQEPRTLLAGGTGGIWRSSDAGIHWQQVFSNPTAYVAAFARLKNGTRLYAGVIPGPDQVLESDDRGRSWHRASNGFDGSEGIMALQSIDNTLLAGTMAHRVWRLSPAPAVWQPSGLGLPAGSHGTALLATTNQKTVWSGTMGDGVYVSHDLGHSWKRFGPPLPGTAGIILALAQHGSTLLAGTATGIFRLAAAP